MSGFVILWSKLGQNSFLISDGTSRPPRKVKRMTFVICVNSDESSTTGLFFNSKTI